MLYHGGAESTNTAAGSGEGGGHLRWNPLASSREPGAGAARSRVFCWRMVVAGEGPVGGRGLRGFFAFSGGRKGGRAWSREGCVLAVGGILAVLWGGWNRAGLPAGPAEAGALRSRTGASRRAAPTPPPKPPTTHHKNQPRCLRVPQLPQLPDPALRCAGRPNWGCFHPHSP